MVMKMKENINALDEMNKGCCMGMDAISFIIEKVDDKNLKKSLKVQYNKYKDVRSKIEKLYPKYNGEDQPHETNKMEKIMTYYGIEMKTMMDDSSSKIAELLLKGTNMGIIEGRRLLNNKEIDKKVNNLLEEYVQMQEDSVENLKKYL